MGILLGILYIILGILAFLLVLILFLTLIKFSVILKYIDDDLSVLVSIFGIRINVLKLANKFKKEKKTEEKDDKKPFEIKKIIAEKDKYLEAIPDVLDILSELAFSFYFKVIDINVCFGMTDPSKTGEIIGGFWAMYGNITNFIFANFLVKKHKVNVEPLWEVTEFRIIPKAEIVICFRIINILRHIKFKKLIDLRKKVL